MLTGNLKFIQIILIAMDIYDKQLIFITKLFTLYY